MPSDVILPTNLIRHLPGLSVRRHVELFHLFPVERAGPDATDNGNLVSRFIHRTVPIQSLGKRQRR